MCTLSRLFYLSCTVDSDGDGILDHLDDDDDGDGIPDDQEGKTVFKIWSEFLDQPFSIMGEEREGVVVNYSA